MKILYVSVHQILEFDEIRMLKDLGHTVFPLGAYFGFKPFHAFRPSLDFNEDERALMGSFQSSGCAYSYGSPADEQVLTAEFVDNFDVVLVMHSLDFIEHHWDVISRRCVVWRTIGVNIEAEEERIVPFRAQGCKIVRYSPKEALATRYAGHDVVIRFGKIPEDFAGWKGDSNQALVFSNQIRTRFPAEYENVRAALDGIPHAICGVGNEDVPNSTGIVPYEQQLSLLSASRVYLYGVGTFITYTLNFMEAWMSGIPVVVLGGQAVLPEAQFKFAEIPELIDDRVNGFFTTSASEARDTIGKLLADKEAARKVGQAGREKAISLFGAAHISALWKQFLDGLASQVRAAR